MKPKIGVISRFMAKENHYATGANYINAVVGAGGIPIQFPINPAEPPETLVSLVDGIIITGGADVAPLSYGEQPHPKVTRTFRKNDIYEIEMIQAAIRQNKPILAICRGIQILNVSLGGTLYQDIPSQTKNEICHYQDSAARGEMTHSISIAESSHLYHMIGKTETLVNSYHHQSVKTLADSLKAVATAPDGIIEAVESEDGMIFGVQWHPESLCAISEEHARIFASFIERCQSVSTQQA